MLFTFLTLVGLHWYFMGILMTGESPELSSRVKRKLPQSLLGRGVLGCFSPGPGTGYVFALGNCAAAGLLAFVMASVYWDLFTGMPPDSLIAFILIEVGYLAIYLGLGFMAMRLLRKVMRAGMLVSVLVQIVLFLFGVIAPWTFQASQSRWYGSDYSYLQITNPFWTLSHVSSTATADSDRFAILLLVSAVALAVFLLNLPAVAREMRQSRVERPRRVEEEDNLLAAQKSPPQPVHTSPWD